MSLISHQNKLLQIESSQRHILSDIMSFCIELIHVKSSLVESCHMFELSLSRVSVQVSDRVTSCHVVLSYHFLVQSILIWPMHGPGLASFIPSGSRLGGRQKVPLTEESDSSASLVMSIQVLENLCFYTRYLCIFVTRVQSPS